MNAPLDDFVEYTLGDLFEFSNGVNAPKSSYGSGIPFANVLEVITRESLDASDIPGRVQLSREEEARYQVRHGDVLFNRTSETQEEVGLASTYVGQEPVVFGGFVLRGRPRTALLDVAYSKYALRATLVRDQIVSRGQGGIRANIGQRDLSTVVIWLPSLERQRHVAARLDHATASIVSLERLIAKNREVRTGLLQSLLSGSRRLPGFADEWRQASYGEVIRFRRGEVASRASMADGSIPLIAAGMTAAGWVAVSNRLGPVITVSASGASAGYVAWHDGAIFASDCITVERGQGYELKFIYYSLLAHQADIFRAQSGGAQPHVHAKDVYPIELALPSFEEQGAIARVLNDVDAEIEVLQRRLRSARAVKQGLTQELISTPLLQIEGVPA